MRSTPVVNLITLFRHKFTNSCLSYTFPKHRRIMVTHWSSLQKSVIKFTPKKFDEIEPWPYLKAFHTVVKTACHRQTL
jgi:hypothetical protein